MGRYRSRNRGRGRGGGADGNFVVGRGGGHHQGQGPAAATSSPFAGGGPSSRILRRGIRGGRGIGGRGRGFCRGRGGFGENVISRVDSNSKSSYFSRGRPRRSKNSKKWGRLVATIEKQVQAEVQKCVECKKDNPPYRCPKCYKKYCSVWCCQTHASGSKCVPIDEILKSSSEELSGVYSTSGGSRRKSSAPKQYLYPSKDTVRPETLAKLTQPPFRDTVLVMFKSKNLREKVGAIDNSTNSTKLFDAFMKDAEFAKFSSLMLEALSDQFVDDVSNNMAQLQVQKSL